MPHPYARGNDTPVPGGDVFEVLRTLRSRLHAYQTPVPTQLNTALGQGPTFGSGVGMTGHGEPLEAAEGEVSAARSTP